MNPIQDGHFWGCSWMEGGKKDPLPKICHTYPTVMKLGTVIPYLKKIQKYMNHVTRLLTSADSSIFSPEISKSCYTKKYGYQLHFSTWFLIPLAFLESLRICLINLVIILMMAAKMATPSLLKIAVFEIKVMTSQFMSMTSTTKLYYMIQIIL